MYGQKIVKVTISFVVGLGVALVPLSRVNAVPNAGDKCTKVGVTKKVSSKNLKCTLVGENLIWVAQKTAAKAKRRSNATSLGRLGSACTTNGVISLVSGLVVTCKLGKVRYAMPEDLPAAPPTGYTKRPSWYPTIAQVLGGSNPEPTCSSSTIKFTKPVIPLDQLEPIIPYGMMIHDHVTPIDHGYLGLKSLLKQADRRTSDDYVNVTSPADGTIIELSSLGHAATNRVVIDHGCGVYSVYMVLNRGDGLLADSYRKLNGGYLRLSIAIKAGEVFGQQRDNPLDFNVFDGSQWLSGLASPASYLTSDTWKPYTADYLPFFESDIRAAMEALLQRTVSPRVGKIDYDVVGSASGNWFLEGTFGYGGIARSKYQNATEPVGSGFVEGKNTYAWSHLAIAPHQVDTTKWIFSIGWKDNPAGDPVQYVLGVADGQPEPNELTADSGAVVYNLFVMQFDVPSSSGSQPYPVGYQVSGGAPKGTVVLQINSNGTLSVEFGTTFTSAKRTYTR